MNRLKKVFALVSVLGSLAMSEDHIPTCGGHGAQSICWSYALARAFGKTWNSAVCPARDQVSTSFSAPFFVKYSYDIDEISDGDVIVWENDQFVIEHVAYVQSISSRDPQNINLNQVDGSGGAEQTPTLYAVIHGINCVRRGSPTHYFRKQPIWGAIVTNSFGGGRLMVGGQEGDIPVQKNGLHWNSAHNIEAIDLQPYQGYRRIFTEWKKGSAHITSAVATTIVIEGVYSSPATYTAHFVKECSLTVQTSLPYAEEGGQIQVDGEYQNATYFGAFNENTEVELQAT